MDKDDLQRGETPTEENIRAFRTFAARIEVYVIRIGSQIQLKESGNMQSTTKREWVELLELWRAGAESAEKFVSTMYDAKDLEDSIEEKKRFVN